LRTMEYGHQSHMKMTLIFDVCGTLVDSSWMARHLAQDLGPRAGEFAECWKEKQAEYSFRRGLMRDYVDFSVCKRDALEFTCRRFKTPISVERRGELLRLYRSLPTFSDVKPAFEVLYGKFRLFALSNGKRSEVDALLANAQILEYFEGTISADDVRSFKPDPVVYHHAKRATRTLGSPCWLISSYPWDIIGGGSAGLATVWVKRSEEEFYGPWGSGPNITVRSLLELPAALAPCRADG
jgi:2-haloacid dehalogenase